jgi:hypothetical protein
MHPTVTPMGMGLTSVLFSYLHNPPYPFFAKLESYSSIVYIGFALKIV